MTGIGPNGLRTAIGFLTRVPISTPAPAIAAAAPWFPFVGLLIGAAQGAVLIGARQILPPLPAAAVAVAAAVLLTGAFHHDGLADVADAFGGGWDVEQRLSILKDSRLGTYGTAALVLALATELSVLASLSAADGFRAVVAAHCLSRGAALAVMVRAPLAGDGLGAAYAADLGPLAAATGIAFAVAATAFALAEPATVVGALVAAAVASAAMVGLAIRKIGGVTGDVLGAVQQLASLAILLVAAASWGATG